MMRRDLILFGPPGAGKGTQGALLAEQLGLLRLSTGDVLRAAVRHGTAMGRKARRYMDAGELVPDEVILGIVGDYLRGEAAERGVIFDGFPRTIPQARSLHRLLAELHRPLDTVLVLEVDDEALVERLSARRYCVACGATYNLVSEPEREDGRCTACGGELAQRPDDDPDTIRRRLQVYQQQTAPLLDYYEAAAVPVRRVDGQRPVPEVYDDLLATLVR
jgi:adenylate kinase